MLELALLILPLVATVVYLLWWVLGGRKKVPRIVNLRGYPILGNILDFLPCNILESLEKYTKAYGSLFVMHSFNRRVFVVSDPYLVREILMKRPKHFRRPYESDHTGKVMGISKGLVHSSGALWSRIRRVTAPSFSKKSVGYMVPGVELEVEAWINRLKELSTEGLAIDMTQEAFTLTIRDLLAFMLRYSLQRLPFWLWRISPWYYFERRALDATIRFSKHCQEVLDYKRAHPKEGGNAMIDTLLERSTRDIAEGGLSDEEIQHNMRIFYIAGFETTSVTINWCCYFLSLYPEVQQKIRQEVIVTIAEKEQALDTDCVKALFYTRAVIRETMRLRNAVALIALDLESDIQSVTLSNQLVVERGDMVWAYVEGAMHSEDIFHHAADFIPERWLSAHTDATQLSNMDEAFLAFGSGPRVCPGMHLAVLEAVLAVASLVRAFDVQLACDASEIHRVTNITLAPNKMPLKLALRK
eukprot:gene32339-39109_t